MREARRRWGGPRRGRAAASSCGCAPVAAKQEHRGNGLGRKRRLRGNSLRDRFDGGRPENRDRPTGGAPAQEHRWLQRRKPRFGRGRALPSSGRGGGPRARGRRGGHHGGAAGRRGGRRAEGAAGRGGAAAGRLQGAGREVRPRCLRRQRGRVAAGRAGGAATGERHEKFRQPDGVPLARSENVSKSRRGRYLYRTICRGGPGRHPPLQINF